MHGLIINNDLTPASCCGTNEDRKQCQNGLSVLRQNDINILYSDFQNLFVIMFDWGFPFPSCWLKLWCISWLLTPLAKPDYVDIHLFPIA